MPHQGGSYIKKISQVFNAIKVIFALHKTHTVSKACYYGWWDSVFMIKLFHLQTEDSICCDLSCCLTLLLCFYCIIAWTLNSLNQLGAVSKICSQAPRSCQNVFWILSRESVTCRKVLRNLSLYDFLLCITLWTRWHLPWDLFPLSFPFLYFST